MNNEELEIAKQIAQEGWDDEAGILTYKLNAARLSAYLAKQQEEYGDRLSKLEDYCFLNNLRDLRPGQQITFEPDKLVTENPDGSIEYKGRRFEQVDHIDT